MNSSIWKNLSTHLEDKELPIIIEEIKAGLVKEQILSLRKLLREGKNNEYDRVKRLLPSFTPSGTFNSRRKIEFLNQYNGNIVLDIDDLKAPLLQHTRGLAIEHEYTYACFISPSGEGLKIIARTNASPTTHKEIFTALMVHYENVLNVFIDASGKDIARLCLYSFDPDTYLNPDSKVFTK